MTAITCGSEPSTDFYIYLIYYPKPPKTTIAAQYPDFRDVPLQELDLPHLRQQIGRISDSLEDGWGFHVLKSLPVHTWNTQQSQTVFWTLANLAGYPEG